MKRLVLLILASIFCYSAALAIPAYPGQIRYTQPDGSVIILLRHGDEFCHWLTNENGDVVELGSDGYFHLADKSLVQARTAAGRMRREALDKSRRGALKAGIATGQKHFLVILVQFQDVSFSFDSNAEARQAFDNLLNQEGYSVNGAHGSARDYYYDNSHGYFEPIFDVYGPVTVSEDMAYYGSNDTYGNDRYPHLAVKEGCELLNSQVDFSQYDNDGDGEVDLVFMYYAGYGEADSVYEDTIWPHQWNLSSAGTSLTLDGTSIKTYACTNEIVGYGTLKGKMCGIGTACHEFGHAMGLPDFYDTDYTTNGEAGGLYNYSLMCSGSYNDSGRRPPYFNMEERIMLGWLDESAITEITTSGNYALTSVQNNVGYKTATDQDGEYFLYECRTKTGWDTDIDEDGLIVFHVDKSDRSVQISSTTQTAKSLWDNWTWYNSINENGSHPCFYIVPAGSQSNLNYSGSRFAFPGAAYEYSFTGNSWNGVDCDVKLSNISYSDNQVTFYAEAPSTSLNYNVIANPGNGSYTAGNEFELALVESTAQPVSSVSWYFDDEPVSASSVTLTAGTHVVEAHLTMQSGETKILELTLNVN